MGGRGGAVRCVSSRQTTEGESLKNSLLISSREFSAMNTPSFVAVISLVGIDNGSCPTPSIALALSSDRPYGREVVGKSCWFKVYTLSFKM
ncbi:hypothetical protein CEXT_335861 [Caerostris extrusa]|uniref:Uncharacterized protein n=1 Tax=Caerostris extrusa TaxID=172846 RepID=A0AAV4M3J8_CAEEX|nr:hypothetical protein CEXT_335861 [Caerostris extrusa]